MSWNVFFRKISKDLLVSLMITYFLLLIPEIVLPGIISGHFSPKYLLAAILALALAYTALGAAAKRDRDEKADFGLVSRNILHIIIFVVAIMLLLSLYKMKIWQILIVSALSIILILSAGNVLIDEE